MHNLIEQLFESQGLTRKFPTDLALYEYSMSGKKNYWLVVFGEPIITPEIQAKWLNECKAMTSDPALEKNINLLIVWNTDSPNVLSSKRIHHAEEDSFFFKKHVLPYTTAELEALYQQIDIQRIAAVFQELITSPNTFVEYKSHYLQGGWQSLLYRIAIKLPFIAVNSFDNSNLASLERSIAEKIQRTDNPSLVIAIDKGIDALADYIVSQDVLPEELLVLLDDKLSEAGYEIDC
ncbi:ABC-three component system middle component 1 [Enterobacter sp. 22452]|uniref:ABC-three component system middle component 1 n=1 Tax=Enterobacter TaxID=547 RepID=UPI003F850B9B